MTAWWWDGSSYVIDFTVGWSFGEPQGKAKLASPFFFVSCPERHPLRSIRSSRFTKISPKASPAGHAFTS